MRIPDGWALIVPESPDAIADTARRLLRIADFPADVRTQRGGREFLVPVSVADRYNKPQNRRGRTKKESTDG